MALTKTEKEWILQTATLAAQTYIDKILPTVLESHMNSCKHGKSILKIICFSIGFGIGSGIIGVGAGMSVARMFGM